MDGCRSVSAAQYHVQRVYNRRTVVTAFACLPPLHTAELERCLWSLPPLLLCAADMYVQYVNVPHQRLDHTCPDEDVTCCPACVRITTASPWQSVMSRSKAAEPTRKYHSSTFTSNHGCTVTPDKSTLPINLPPCFEDHVRTWKPTLIPFKQAFSCSDQLQPNPLGGSRGKHCPPPH